MAEMSAQKIITCNLCERDPKVKWKCVECEFLMCNNCKEKIHAKFKHAKDHTIIDIKDVGQEFAGIKCRKHPEVPAAQYCEKCEQFVCQNCDSNDHSGHQQRSIKDVYEMKLKKVKTARSNFEMRQVECKSLEEAIDYMMSDEARQKISQKLLQDIEIQRDAMKKDIDVYADQLRADVQAQISMFQDRTKKDRILEIKRFIGDQIATADNLIQATDKPSFFILADEFFKHASIVPTMVGIPPTIKFVPTKALKATVGIFAHEYFPDTVNIGLKIVRKFATELDECTCITVDSRNEQLWIGDGKNKAFQCITLKGERLQKVNVDAVVNDIQIKLPDCALMACGKQNLMLVNETNGLLDSSGINAGTLNIISAHVTRDQFIVVGAKSPGPARPVQGKRVAILMDTEGNHLKVFENDEKGDRLFTFPKKITSTANGNLFIIDLFSTDNKCKVKAITQEGELLSVYVGNPGINTDLRPFTATDLASSGGEKVLICDFPDYFHILGNTGQPLFILNTRSFGIDMVYCLSFLDDKRLFLGNSPRGVDRARAEVYEVEYSE